MMANSPSKPIQIYVNCYGEAFNVGDVAKVKHKFSGFGEFALACRKASGGVMTAAMKHWKHTCEILNMK